MKRFTIITQNDEEVLFENVMLGGSVDADGNISNTAKVVEQNVPAEKTYNAFVFGDESSTVATVASVEKVSNPIDISLLDPSKSSLEVTVTGSTVGDFYVDISRNGVDDWAQVHTVAYTAVGNSLIKMSDVGYGFFMRLRATDSSVNAGTIKSILTARGA